ncbi:MAG: DUF2851 family protein [Verrucomicrobiae bacterium]|nr:DUF2851 family protein [Verrucomicrobiae bacterium]NNJ87020.1 DUF2851 family protein [Akkermansiaceae bacterium]
MCGYLELLENVRADGGGVREDEGLHLPSEMRLQASWFAGQMGRDFSTVDGKQVRVVQFGHWNHAAGPDFLHAAVEIDGAVHKGAIELDHTATNWDAHGHAESEAFNDVILHVVFAADEREYFTRTQNHKEVPRVVVSQKMMREAMNIPLVAVAAAHPGRCFTPLADMHGGNIDALMREAALHRARIKALRRSRTEDALGKNEWLWQALAEALGYRPNKLAMTLLAQRLPVDELRQSPGAMESILFGAAGFLSVAMYEQAEAESRDYLRDLWQDWWRVRDDYEPVSDRRIPWKLSGIRPVNHPQRRLACLVMVARRWDVFTKACQTIDGVNAFFECLEHPYWSHHYTLKSKRSERSLALLGVDRIRDFQINHLIPARLAAGDRVAWEYYQKAPAPALSEKVDKAALRLFGSGDKRKKFLRKAWQHQALLQIYQDFCLRDVSDCDKCPFPEQLAQWRG